jgi:GxxExxY protein
VFADRTQENGSGIPKLRDQHGITVYYDDEVVGEFVADVIVEDAVILELKSVRRVVST